MILISLELVQYIHTLECFVGILLISVTIVTWDEVKKMSYSTSLYTTFLPYYVILFALTSSRLDIKWFNNL
jgi:hypothetical protein